MDRSRPPAARPTLFLLAAALLAPAAGHAQEPPPASVQAGDPIELTLERMVEYALEGSYRMRHLNLDLERSRLYLAASRARLKSRVDLDFTVPTINHISETRWSSELGRNVIDRENSRRVEAELSIRQPVVLFGYPTNGYLSLNNRMYRLTQHEEDERDVRYYNRYFVRYTQPLFQANRLKNELEEAELDLESQELEFYEDVVEIIDNTADNYFELFEIAHRRQILERYVARLERALSLAEAAAAEEAGRSIDTDQIQVELANAREEVSSNRSRFRLEASSILTELGIPRERPVTVDPAVQLGRVPIDVERAVDLALELAPRVRQLHISRRESEIDLDNTEGRGGFELDVSLSYGREMQHETFGDIWEQPENAYTVDVEGSLPIWDWGERKAEIRAQEIGVEQSRLRIEEVTTEVSARIRNEVRNIEEYEERAFNMRENLELSRRISEQSLERYEAGEITVLDLLQSLRREMDTAENFLDAYLGWREALQRIQEMTYYDWERDAPILERFGIRFGDGA